MGLLGSAGRTGGAVAPLTYGLLGIVAGGVDFPDSGADDTGRLVDACTECKRRCGAARGDATDYTEHYMEVCGIVDGWTEILGMMCE